jgi:integrase
MLWDHIERASKLWTIPKTKNGDPLRVPLSNRCMEILKAVPREDDNPLVFVGLREPDMRELLTEMRSGLTGLTVHGFRSAFRTWAGERNFSREVCEAAMAHRERNATVAAYARGDLLEPRRLLMDAWAKYCSTTPVAEGDTVIPMRGRS